VIHHRLRLLLLILPLTWMEFATAYELSGNHWREPQAVFHVGMPGTSPSGVAWSTSLQQALAQWTDKTLFRFSVDTLYDDPCSGRLNGGTGNDRASADFGETICGSAFGSGVLAVTRTSGACYIPSCTTGFYIEDADIVFNSNERWEIYAGNRRAGRTDFGRVALHELGHAIGLQHESEQEAIMQPFVGNLDTLQADDINGIQAIYDDQQISQPRDDQGSAVLASVYGIDVRLPVDSRLRGPQDSLSLSGVLDSGDARLDGRFIDIFQYTLTRDSTANLLMTSSSFNAYLHLVRVDSTQQLIASEVFSDDNSGGSGNARLTQLQLPAGTYWIGATSSGLDEQGSYQITFDSTTSSTSTVQPSVYRSPVYDMDVQVNPNPLIEGHLAQGDTQLGNGSFLDLHEFTVGSNVTLQVDLLSSQFDPYLYLARRLPDGQLLLSALVEDDDGGDATNARIKQLLVPGTYWIGVSSFRPASGAYEVTIQVIP
jgi:hypothetical protein